jgi:hypothetical protein
MIQNETGCLVVCRNKKYLLVICLNNIKHGRKQNAAKYAGHVFTINGNIIFIFCIPTKQSIPIYVICTVNDSFNFLFFDSKKYRFILKNSRTM